MACLLSRKTLSGSAKESQLPRQVPPKVTKLNSIDLLSITGKGGQQVPIENLKDLKTKYLQDLDKQMYSLMHSSVPTKKSTPKDSFDNAVNTAVMKERKNMLEVQAAKANMNSGNKGAPRKKERRTLLLPYPQKVYQNLRFQGSSWHIHRLRFRRHCRSQHFILRNYKCHCQEYFCRCLRQRLF